MFYEKMFSEKNRLDLLRSYFKTNSLAKHQIDTFNQFICSDIARILDNEANCIFEGKSTNSDTGTIYLRLVNPIINNPQIFVYDQILKKNVSKILYPQEARTKMITYDSILYCDIEEYIMNNINIDNIDKIRGNIESYLIHVITHYRIPIARIPIMLKSFKCNLEKISLAQYSEYGESRDDPGGYFIINGNERILVGQMRNAYNKSICQKKKTITGSYVYTCEMRSMSEETGHSALVQLKSNVEYNSQIFIHILKEWINVDHVIIFLKNGEGLTSEQQMFITDDLFPHLGMSASKNDKLIVLKSMIKKINLNKQGILHQDDKDNYSHKRVEMAGLLCYELFRMLFKKYIKSVTNNLDKKHRVDIDLFSKNALITNGLHFSFATGNWGVQKNNYIRTGVSQIIQNKVSVVGSLSHLRKIVIPLGKEGKNTKIRELHQSSVFFVCPSETPEGQFVGLTLSLSMLCNISLYSSTFILKRYITDMCKDTYLTCESYCVFINGSPCGYTKDTLTLETKIKKLKISGNIPKDLGIFIDYHMKEFHISSDPGRLTRPLINVKAIIQTKNTSKIIPWNNLQQMCEHDYVVYHDATNIENLEIAINNMNIADGPPKQKTYVIKYNWMEIHPSCMLGIMAAQIPYCDHTQSPRNCYQASMAKQAIGYIPAFSIRSNTSAKVSNLLEKPLVTTQIAKMTGSNTYPNGVNVIVAELIYTGFNQEDSIIIKKEAIERGLFYALSIKTVTCEEKIGKPEKICIPPGPIRRSYANYENLETDLDSNYYGIIKPRTYVKKNDIIVGKISKITEIKGEITEIDKSIICASGDEGFVHEIIKTSKQDVILIKIIIVQSKIPEIGDKFCSAMAQKGTVGMIMPEIDMPFCSDGVIPDLLINPHCIPSRMTINQLMSSIHGLLCCAKGIDFGDASPFQESFSFAGTEMSEKESKISFLRKELVKCGLSNNGTVKMMNGMTGEKIKANIFMGPVYYHRLTHIVSDKIFARPNTHQKRNALTRQPLNGRANDGGLRVGEMEKDCLLAYGCPTFLQEKMFDQSDKFYAYICKKCKQYTTIEKYTTGQQTYMICSKCDSAEVSKIILPFATKLVFQELNALCIKTELDISHIVRTVSTKN
jgi:DNA-directed RNA polymerase II subunit RPB2